MESPAFGLVRSGSQPERDDFDGPQLGVAWNFLGTPGPNVWELSDRPGALRLLGNEARLDDGPPVAFVGRRQEHFACEVATRIDFEPAADGDPKVLRFVANGRPLPEHEIKLVDEQGNPVGERVQGRLFFRGPSKTSGYFRDPQATAEITTEDRKSTRLNSSH